MEYTQETPEHYSRLTAIEWIQLSSIINLLSQHPHEGRKEMLDRLRSMGGAAPAAISLLAATGS